MNDSHVNETRSKIVVFITFVTMILEISFGHWTNSMALFAEGWHLSTHVFALSLTWFAYFIARKYSNTEKYSFDSRKLLSLSGFISAIGLLVVVVFMFIESVSRLLNPLEIQFREAIVVAIIGLIVNLVSASVLHSVHNHDHNIHAAYIHIIADALTGIATIISLIAGLIWNIKWLDSIVGIISAVVISKWALSLLWNAGKELVDFKNKKEV